MNTVWIVLGIIGILLLTAVYLYNRIISNYNAVVRSWADLIAQERQKNKVLPRLEEITKEYREYEKSLQTNITQLREAINLTSTQVMNNESLSDIEIKTHSLLKGIKVALENYPDLKASEVMCSLMHEISNQQANIAAAISIFNRNVEIFNNDIQTFPANIINDYLNHQQSIIPFTDKQAASGFEYNPSLTDKNKQC